MAQEMPLTCIVIAMTTAKECAVNDVKLGFSNYSINVSSKFRKLIFRYSQLPQCFRCLSARETHLWPL